MIGFLVFIMLTTFISYVNNSCERPRDFAAFDMDVIFTLFIALSMLHDCTQSIPTIY